MLNKIKFLGIIFMSILLLTNCNKDAKQDPNKEGEIVFAAIDITPDKDIECDLTLTAKYAKIVINGDPYYPEVFVIDNKLYTQAIKLDEGIGYELQFFALMDDMGTPDMGDDKIVKASPGEGPYAQYVSYILPYYFDIIAFRKFELKIDVLCYIPAVHWYFGFVWWEVTEITIREQCFFGDFCIKHLPDYVGSNYELDGLQLDEVAIFKIVASRVTDDVYYDIGTFYNTYGGQGELFFKEPLCIEYPDYDRKTDIYSFELWIYVKVGAVFEYEYFHTWTFMDDEMIVPMAPEGDGVVDFVLGNCNYSPTDLLLPPWMNLPSGIGYQIVTYPYVPSYFQVDLTGVGPGYDIGNGLFDAWCADADNTISVGPLYCMNAYSSLYVDMLPLGWDLKGDALGRTNWLFNNLHLVVGLPGYNATEMQHALWNIFDNKGYGGVAQVISDMTLGHEGFSPLPGGWAAVLYFECSGVYKQITFRVVDP